MLSSSPIGSTLAPDVNADFFAAHIAALIRKSGALRGVDDASIQAIAEAATWFSLPGGNTLFCQGDPSDALYIAINGLLGGSLRKTSGEEIAVGRIGPGEVIGEMGCVLGEPRSATIRALRTSELIAVSREALDELSRRNAEILRALYRTVVERLRRVEEGRPTRYRPRTFCLLPHLDDQSAHVFARDFTAALGTLGSTFLFTPRDFANATVEQFRKAETAHEHVVYLAEGAGSPWSRLCLSQADAILRVVRGTDPVIDRESPASSGSADIPVELILLWPDRIVAGKTDAWLERLQPTGHHHVRSRADVGRAARLLTGRGIGLVLSGGGARGLSHLGVGRALLDHGVSIDAICGTSIGAIIGGSLAMEWEFQTLRDRMDVFSRKHPLRELVVPRLSILSGRHLSGSSEMWFGDWAIEDTPIRFACVTTDLNMCAAAVHRRGKLATWIRASSSLPGVFPPVVAGGSVHVDGGVVNNLPSDAIRDMGAGMVVAADVGFSPATFRSNRKDKGQSLPLPNILELLMRVGTMSDEARSSTARRQCSILLAPNVQHIGLLDWRAYDDAIKCGYDCVVANIEQIKHAAAAAAAHPSASL
jgi:NTE family protein